MSATDFSKPTPFLVNAVHGLHAGKALDIGCGNGRNTLYLAKEGWEVVAIDVDGEAIDKIKYDAEGLDLRIQASQEDIRTFETDEKFGLIACLMVLHFFTEEEIKQVVTWMQDHTISGGKNIISGFTDKNTPGTRPYLFKLNELTGYYSSWLIDTYEEADSSLKTAQGNLLTYNVARLLATKE